MKFVPRRAQASIRERYQWRKVVAPKPWYPEVEDAELVGFYGGRTLRSGVNGQYEVVIIHVPIEGTYMLTGTQLIQLMDASMIQIGHPIRVIWKGTKVTANGYKMKMFEVMVADGEAIAEEDLPEVH